MQRPGAHIKCAYESGPARPRWVPHAKGPLPTRQGPEEGKGLGSHLHGEH